MHDRVGAEATAASSASSTVTGVGIDTPSFRIIGGRRRLAWQWHVLFGIVLFVAAFQFRLTRLATSGSASALATFASTTFSSAISAMASAVSAVTSAVSAMASGGSSVISSIISSIIATVITMITTIVTSIVAIATSVISSGTTTASSAAIIARIIVIVPIVRFLRTGLDGAPLSSRSAMARNAGNFDGMMIVLAVCKNVSHDINNVGLS